MSSQIEKNSKSIALSINQIGIGDLTFLAAWIVKNGYKHVDINLSSVSLHKYRGDPAGYKTFAFEYMRHILPDVELVDSKNTHPVLRINNGDRWFGLYDNLINEDMAAYFVNIFNPEHEKNNDQICVVTKARNLPSNRAEKIIEKTINVLNASNKRLILVGEREIEYNAEYQIHGADKIYSTYSMLASQLRSDLVTDITVAKLGLTTPSLQTLLADLKVMTSSKKTIVFGGGGMFCTNILCGSLLSICDRSDAFLVPSQIGKQLHYDYNSFEKMLVAELTE